MKRDLPRVLGLFDATMLVVSSIIGVGIFLFPPEVAQLLPSVPLFLAAWVVGGLLSLAGALANAELSTMFPAAGGNYVYLREGVHPLVGYVIGFQAFFAIFAGTVATLATGLATTASGFVPISEGGKLAFAAVVIVLISIANAFSTRLGALLNGVTGLLRVGLLAVLVLVGLLAPRNGLSTAVPSSASPGAAAFFAALSPVLFTYTGWNATAFVGGEVRDPAKNLPRSLFLGLGIATAIYLGVTIAYVRVLGMNGIAISEDVGTDTARALFAERGAPFARALVFLSILGALYANVLTGPRIVFAMAKDGLLPRFLAEISHRRPAPRAAIAVQALVALILVFAFRRLDLLLDYTTFALVLATICDTLALYALRIRRREAERPYRALGYPLLPLAYIAANAAIAVALFVKRPRECVLGLAVVGVGAIAYTVGARFRSAR